METPNASGCLWRVIMDAIIVALIVLLLDKIGWITIHYPAGW